MAKAEKEEEEKKLAEEVSERVQAKLNSAKERLNNKKEEMMDYVAENPVRSLLIAAGIGFVVGSIMTKLMHKMMK